ncbi:MAG: sulfotransferase domain-containing protein [Actinomycetia bacterium]|nr:sulfotransferase domain-containing protein [Actinomycetes bacterium]
MSLRSSVPAPAKGLLRRGYVRLGAMTAHRRAAPDFLVVGAQRGGTTSLFRALEQHPFVLRPSFSKGINYFDLNYDRGSDWYAGHFPLTRTADRRRPNGESLAVFEASGYYLFHPAAPARIVQDLPSIKIVAMLREPGERAFSAWKHENARGYDDETFEGALRRETERTAGEVERMLADPRYQSYAHRHYSYGARSDYVPQLRQFYDRLPADQIHVMYSETFFEEPETEFRALTDFLGVDHKEGIVFEQHNARRSGAMPGPARELLSDRFRDQAEELEALVGRRPPW